MLRITNLSNVFQKRLVRPKYAHTQGFPYAGSLHPSLRDSEGSFRKPLAADTLPLARSADAFTYKGGLVPGTVVLKAEGESFVVATGANAALRPFGLLGQFVGGELDDLKDNNEIGVWQGPDSVYEILAPAFNDTGLAAAYAAATPGIPVLLYAGADGRLGVNGTPGSRLPVAELIERPSASKITIRSLV
jgi:hypothetical protein